MGKKFVGERSCMGCGKKSHKTGLLRFVVWRGGDLLVDLRQSEDGRGGYLCPVRRCFDKAAKKRRLGVRFRQTVQMDPAGLQQEVQRRLEGEIQTLRNRNEDNLLETLESLYFSICRE